jgi:ATP-binding cassette subfamily C protein LapB
LFSRFLANKQLASQLLASSFFINLLALSSSLFVIHVLNRYVSHGVEATLASLAAGVLIAIGFEWAFRDVRRRLIFQMNAHADEHLALEGFATLSQGRTAVLDRIPAGLRSETVRGVDAIHAAFAPQNVAALMDLPFALLFVVAVALLSPQLALVASALIGVGLLLTWRTQTRTQEPQAMMQRALADRTGLLSASLRDGDTLRAFNGSAALRTLWERTTGLIQQYRNHLHQLRDTSQARISMLQGIMTVGVISLGAMQVVAGELSVGALIGANILAARALSPVMRVAQLGETFAQAKQALQKLSEFSALPKESEDGASLRSYQGNLVFEDVALAFPGQKIPLFESLGFSLKAGDVLAVVGANGSGKTTLARLMLGLLEPARGQIRMDGVDLRQLNLSWWRKQVVYLPQEPGFLPMTLLENLQAANPEATEEQINQAIRDAGLRSWLDSTPDGLQTRLQDAHALAVGIRRRIALARALLTQGQLVVADEPTEGLDGEGRSLVMNVLESLHKQGKTLVICSHDPNFLRGANYLLDLSQKPVPRLQKRTADEGLAAKPQAVQRGDAA